MTRGEQDSAVRRARKKQAGAVRGAPGGAGYAIETRHDRGRVVNEETPCGGDAWSATVGEEISLPAKLAAGWYFVLPPDHIFRSTTKSEGCGGCRNSETHDGKCLGVWVFLCGEGTIDSIREAVSAW